MNVFCNELKKDGACGEMIRKGSEGKKMTEYEKDADHGRRHSIHE